MARTNYNPPTDQRNGLCCYRNAGTALQRFRAKRTKPNHEDDSQLQARDKRFSRATSKGVIKINVGMPSATAQARLAFLPTCYSTSVSGSPSETAKNGPSSTVCFVKPKLKPMSDSETGKFRLATPETLYIFQSADGSIC